MANKKITLKNKAGEKLYPSTIMEQVVGINEALDGKLDGSGAIDVVGAINITGTDSTQSKLTFARETFNYIAAKGKIGIAPNNINQTSEYGFWFSNEGVIPGTYMSNSYNLGSSSVKWRNVYATTFNGTATAVIDGSISTSKIATAAITPAKIQTSIALNGTPSMTVEPTTYSPDKTIASVGLVKEAVADLKIDTRNLLTNSKEITIDASTLTSGTKMLQKKLPISVEVGDVLTFNCEDMIINAGTDETHAILLYSGGALAAVKYISPTSKTATITVTKASTTPYLYMYAGFSDDSAGKSITYKGATLVKGDKPMLLWQRAVEDLDDVADYTVMPNLISASDFELGGIADATGNNSATTSASRARSAGYIPVSAPKITLKSWTDGVVFYLQLYKSDKTHIGTSFSSTGWVSAKYTYTLPSGTAYIRVVMKKSSGAEFTASELTTIKIKAENGSKATDWSPTPEDIISGISNAETRSKAHAEDYTDAEITKIENGETVAQKANSLYDEDSGLYKVWKDVTNAVGDEVEEVLKQNNFATKDDIQSIIPSNATETGAGIVRAATQAEVNDGHVSDNDPSEMAFVRPETLKSKLDTSYPTIAVMTQAISESKEEVKGVVSAMDFPIEQVQGLKEALDEKLPLSGGTLTGEITAPSFKTNLTSGVAEAVMAYPVNISWSNDLNSDTYLKAGMYQMSSVSNTLNQPCANGYGNVITVKGDAEVNKNNVGQIYLGNLAGNSKAYIRAGQAVEGGYHIFDSKWREVRFIDDLVTTSHIADTAITPVKIQTSIALNGTPSMTVEPTTSSPDKTIASVGLVKEVMEDIEIGGRNLILNGDFSRGAEHWSLWSRRGTLSVEDKNATFSLDDTYQIGMLLTSSILLDKGQQYVVSFDVKSDGITSLDYCYLVSSAGIGNIMLPSISGITTEWQRLECKFTATQTGDYKLGFGMLNAAGKSFSITNVKIEKGNKATDWSPAPEDINTEISNAETRSKAHAEDYTDAEITKIENGETVAQKANSLYDEDSGDWKIWKDVTNAVGDEVEEVLKQNNFATKDDIQSIIPSNATETGAGIVRAATQAEVNDGHVSDNDPSEMAFVRPETLDSYIDSKGFATTSDISSAVTAAKPTIFFQAAQPAGGKDGDIWIIP